MRSKSERLLRVLKRTPKKIHPAMRINITPRHISAAANSNGRRTPVELAVMDLDCFEEISLMADGNRFYLTLDGDRVKLPGKVGKALQQFQASQAMSPMSFNLPVESQTMDFEEFSMDLFDDVSFGY